MSSPHQADPNVGGENLGYGTPLPAAGLQVAPTNLRFRDGFADGSTQPDPNIWTLSNDSSDPVTGHILSVGGDSSGSAYLRISLSPFLDDSEVSLTSKQVFTFPSRLAFGLSVSQRIVGQEVFVGIVGSVSDGTAIDTISTIADKAITGTTISITSNVGTVTLTAHGYKGGDRVGISGCAEDRLNVDPVLVTVVDANTFTVPITLANGSYSSVGGTVKVADPLRYAKNGAGLLFENATVTNGSFVSRRSGSKARILNTTTASTNAVQSSTSPYTDAFNSTAVHELVASIDEISFRSYATDSTASPSGMGKWTQAVPDETVGYKLQFRARTLKQFSVPSGRITNITKTASTTATVTTDVPHNLAVGSQVQIYGVLDQTNFPNLTAQTSVASVVDATNFTIVIGPSATVSSSGGTVFRIQGSVLAPGVFSQVVQSVSRTNNILTLVGNGTWATPLPGEYVQVWGMQGTAAQYDGAYKVLRVNTTSLELASTGPDFTSITTGGAVFRRTDVRLHFARVSHWDRSFVEVLGGRGNVSDANNAIPVTVSNTVSPTQGSGSATTQWSAAGWGGLLAADVASAAITSTANSSTITPGTVGNVGVYSHSFNVVVTAVSGTTPTMDIGVEESMDNGTNWVRVYDFPRITANGAYTSPLIRSQHGTRFRYVQTIGGTTPSFTRAINRVQFSSSSPLLRQFIDRSITLTSLNSVTPNYQTNGADSLLLCVNIGAATTPPQLQLEGSEDNGASWYSIGSPLAAVASSTVAAVSSGVLPGTIRVRVSTQGSAVTAGYVLIKALGR